MIHINQSEVLDFIKQNPTLSKAFKYFLESNPGYDNPYHNTNHTLTISYFLLDMWKSMGKRKEIDIESLILAAIFHDFGHSGGRYKDSINIHIAIKYYREFAGPEVNEKVVDLIKATEYPYTVEDLSLEQRMIRECDALCCLSADFLSQVLLGLRSELKVGDMNKMIEGEEQFLDNLLGGFTLERSKYLVGLHKPDIINLLNNLKSICA